MSLPNRSKTPHTVAMTFIIALLSCASGASFGAAVALSDIPIYSASNVPANMMLALSVEYPTGTVAAYTGTADYSASASYLGYFDNAKCYDYDKTNNYFYPAGASGAKGCTGHWSGNMLNWASMTSLDEFRQALTGGYRVIDTTSNTVLQRSRVTGQGSASNFPTKHIGKTANVLPSTVIGDATFGAASDVYICSHDGSTEFTSGTDRGVFIGLTTSSTSCTNPTLFYARVQVCVSSASSTLENNCNSAHKASDYPGAGTYNKPEGLIQQNFQRIRVGAAGYLAALGLDHPNGIIRALIRDNGPTTYNGLGARQSNPNAEWDGKTGIFATNPNPDQITASVTVTGQTPTKSGAINYLNQFGLTEPSYETYDTLAELYWAVLAYYKKLPLDGTYAAAPTGSNSIQLDGFPAIADPTKVKGPGADPIQYSCQSNSIVTIGDSHTWCDTRVPGSALDAKNESGSTCTNHAPLAALSAVTTANGGTDPGLSAATYLKTIGNLPLIEALGSTAATQTMNQFLSVSDLSTAWEPNTPAGATYNMAGMAYYAHTQEQRADVAKNNPAVDKITIDTYTVDVLEPGSYDGQPLSSGHGPIYDPANISKNAGPNMYWLAAKYGGFDDINNDGKPASPLTWHTNSSSVTTKDYHPDNYFLGNRPDLIQSGLAQIFSRVSSKKILSASGPGLSAARVLNPVSTVYNPPTSATGFPLYTTSYTPGDWTGDVCGYIATVDPSTGTVTPGSCSKNPLWTASSQLDILTQAPNTSGTPAGWDTGRRIVTWNGTVGVPFRYGSIASAKSTMNNDPTLLNYLRGDKSNEGTKFRARRHILGDIVDSDAVLVQGAMSPTYTDTGNPGYSAFKTSVQNRKPIIYVAANDGMLHAFAADFSAGTKTNPVAGGGNELFAYVPSFVIAGPSGTPTVDGMAALANLNGVTTNPYAHHFYVDQTPQVADVDFGWTGSSTPGTPDWHTLVVGGLGKGGKGIYALDITNAPPALDTTSSAAGEAQIKKQVLWEFTDNDMGFTFGRPLIVKTRKYGWVVLITSGYNNNVGSQTGKGHLYVVNAETGALLETLDTGAGDTATPSGLGRATAYTRDLSDNTIEQVYAGDLLGNVWRFDLSGTGSGKYPTPVKLAQLQDGSKNPQPITTAPRIELDINSTGLDTRRWVFVGTGKFLDTSDLSDTQQQTMYALRDGTASVMSTTSLPLTRSSLSAVTNLTTGITALGDNDAGWYYDLQGKTAGGATERIVIDPEAAAGQFEIAWGSLVPTSDPCSFQGTIYAADFSTGQTTLVDSAGASVASITTKTALTTLKMVQVPASGSGSSATPAQILLMYGESGLSVGTAKLKPGAGAATVARVNWRELLD